MKDEELLHKVSEIAAGMHFNARFIVLTLVERYKAAKAEIEEWKLEQCRVLHRCSEQIIEARGKRNGG